MAVKVVTPTVLAAIDVGTNAARLKIARALPDGTFEPLHEERDPIRPGEGVFKHRVMRKEVADRLLSTLRRYAALCKRHGGRVRAVATSAIREARNQEEILRRVSRECGFELEVVSGREEARLICLGVLRGKPASQRSILIDVGGGSTEVASAKGETPSNLWSIALGAVRLSEIFDTTDALDAKNLKMIRAYALELVTESLPALVPGAPTAALGSSGSIRALVGFAASPGTGHATRKQITKAVKTLSAMTVDERRLHFDSARAEVILAGAIIVEAVVKRLHLDSVAAVPSGLRDGILVDLIRSGRGQAYDPSLGEAAAALGRRFGVDERHARQVAALSLELFDRLAPMHKLSASVRPLLEAAALLHDVGHAVNYQKHHRHTYYLIHQADIPGLADHQRHMLASVARYHRGSPPSAEHTAMVGFTPAEVQQVTKLATLLRVADCLDRSHHQPVKHVRARSEPGRVSLKVVSDRPVDLELWDAAREAALFKRVFHKRLDVTWVRR